MMNNFGMNPMGMNPMQINNMGMMGMGIQTNLMDQTAQDIKNIIQPYENKIRELEEIIKQKDFEIAVLKHKLNKNSNNANFMNMNPMMNMNIPPLNNNNNEISITIQSNIKCKKNDKASILSYYQRFTCNFRPILLDKTLEENGIHNGSIINLTDKIYTLKFEFSTGHKIILNLDGNCPFKQVVYFLCERYNDQNLYQQLLKEQIKFINNGEALNIYDESPLKIKFYDRINTSIFVLENGRVIG